MDIVITLNTDNAAFEDDATREIARTLRELTDFLQTIDTAQLEQSYTCPLFDYNGNKVGYFTSEGE